MTEEYIKKARIIHRNKYNYDKTIYVNAKTKVTITCPIEGHGDFEKQAESHISKTQPRGCPECGKLKNKKADSFVDRAKEIHGDKYDYSLVKYTKNNEKVIIICKHHGEFLQTPNNHLENHGCPDCVTNRFERIDYLDKLEEIHGDYYDYDYAEFKTQRDDIKIKCPVHGFFEQKLANHLKGSGCKSCGKKNMSNKNKLTNEEFIEKANKFHNNKFNYDDIKYENCHRHIKIRCIKHNYTFEQSPRNHLRFKICCKFCVSDNRLNNEENDNENTDEELDNKEQNQNEYV